MRHNTQYIAHFALILGPTHTEHQCQQQWQWPMQSQWKRQPKHQAEPLKFAICCSVWLALSVLTISTCTPYPLNVHTTDKVTTYM